MLGTRIYHDSNEIRQSHYTLIRYSCTGHFKYSAFNHPFLRLRRTCKKHTPSTSASAMISTSSPTSTARALKALGTSLIVALCRSRASATTVLTG